MNLNFRILIIAGVFFILGGVPWITIFEQGFSGTMSRAVAEDGNRMPHQFGIPQLNDSDEQEHGSGYANAVTPKEKPSDIPITIFAAGDIADCEGDDPWSEELLELAGILPENTGREEEEIKEQPFLEELLELLGLEEELDYYASAEETAELLLRFKGPILALGDLGYPNGSPQSFKECYDRAWGTLKNRTYPVPGNHEYETTDAVPYFAYWGRHAGEPGKGYYSFDLGGWHMIALNSKLEKKDHRDTISAQHAWLQKDLAATKADCILAYWHHPVFSSGQQSGSPRMKNILQTLYTFGVTVILTAHAHDYERFAHQNSEGARDRARGFRQFVVGTGGAPLRPLKKRLDNSEVFRADSFGVLRLDLYPQRYSWQFLPVGKDQPDDMGTDRCATPSRAKA